VIVDGYHPISMLSGCGGSGSVWIFGSGFGGSVIYFFFVCCGSSAMETINITYIGGVGTWHARRHGKW